MICDRCSIVCQFAGEPGECKGVNVCDTKQTNADRIRSMTDEELANAFAMISDCISCSCRSAEDDCSITDGTCQRQWLEWLREEATDG